MAWGIAGYGYQGCDRMTNPEILWVPCLKMNSQDPAYGDRLIRMFLLSHYERGHVLFETGTICSTPSYSSLMPPTIPASGSVWRILPESPVELTTLQNFDGFIELFVSPHHIPITVLETLWPGPKIKRVILTRPKHLSLANFVSAIEGIRIQFPGLGLWVDQLTTGWDALTYLLAIFPDLQPWQVQDNELDKLLSIGQQLGRDVLLTDFSGRPPIKIPFLPRYAPGPARKWRRVPIYPRFV